MCRFLRGHTSEADVDKEVLFLIAAEQTLFDCVKQAGHKEDNCFQQFHNTIDAAIVDKKEAREEVDADYEQTVDKEIIDHGGDAHTQKAVQAMQMADSYNEAYRLH